MILLKVYSLPFFKLTSKSNERLAPPPPDTRSKLTQAICSYLTYTVGLCTNINPLSRGYKNPVLDLWPQDTADKPEWLEQQKWVRLELLLERVTATPLEFSWHCNFLADQRSDKSTEDLVNWSRHLLGELAIIASNLLPNVRSS